MDSDEWEDEEREPIPLNVCLFCSHDAGSLEKKLQHMTEVHKFFIPDLEYCTDVAGLMTYLGWKVCFFFYVDKFLSELHLLNIGHVLFLSQIRLRFKLVVK